VAPLDQAAQRIAKWEYNNNLIFLPKEIALNF
jgi:hypothetical protein